MSHLVAIKRQDKLNVVDLIDSESYCTIETLCRREFAVLCLDLGCDGRLICAGFEDGFIEIWSALECCSLRTLSLCGPVRIAEFDQGCGRLMTVSSRNKLHIWDWQMGVIVMSKAVDEAWLVHFNWDYSRINHLIVESDGLFLSQWDSSNGAPVVNRIPIRRKGCGTRKRIFQPCYKVNHDVDTRTSAVLLENSVAVFEDVEDGGKRSWLIPIQIPMVDVCFTQEGSQIKLVGADRNNNVYIWNILAADNSSSASDTLMVQQFRPDIYLANINRIVSVCCSPDGGKLVCGIAGPDVDFAAVELETGANVVIHEAYSAPSNNNANHHNNNNKCTIAYLPSVTILM